jgi:hypothetical protein
MQQELLGAECVVVELPLGAAVRQLSEGCDIRSEELQYAAEFNTHTLCQYIGGRVALHRAFHRCCSSSFTYSVYVCMYLLAAYCNATSYFSGWECLCLRS